MHEFLRLPLQASTHAHLIDESITTIHWLMFVLFLVWGTFYVFSVVRFRHSKNPKANHEGLKTKAPYVLVGAVALFEGFLLVGSDLPLWKKLTADFPPESEATVIRVVAEQFAWNVHYPGPDGIFGRTDIKLISADNPLGLDRDDPNAKDDITTINQLNIPVNKPVLVYLSSKDVIHSFGIPLLRVKQDAIPGQRVKVSFTPTMTTAAIQHAEMRTERISRTTSADAFSSMVVAEDYKDKNGNALAAKGDPVTQDLIDALLNDNHTSLSLMPSTPMEIACSQLCGLGHFRMRGFVTVQTDEEFKAWLAEQESYLTQ